MAQNPTFESHVWYQWVDCLSCGIAFPRRFDGDDVDDAMVVITRSGWIATDHWSA